LTVSNYVKFTGILGKSLPESKKISKRVGFTSAKEKTICPFL